ncbi:MAG: TRAP transporter substrate-binding protein [Deltaproteobacteria bacterium]|nr:TRAP transporter substrate-binding protein [Deltaproteobacteria bacterium]
MKKGFSVRGAVLTAVGAALLLSGAARAEEHVVKLRYSNMWPPVHPISKLGEEWCKEVEKRTEGRVKISYFPGNTLTPPTQTYDSVSKGIADLGQSLLAYSPGRFPLSEVLTLPLGYTSGAQATALANAYFKKFQPKEFSDTKVMYLHGHGPGMFHTKKDVKGLDELKGLRIKVNAEVADIGKALGVAPVTMPITETYDGLQKGLLEGILLPYEALKGWRFGELVKTTIECPTISYTSSIFFVMNKDKWNQISPKDQQAIEKINEEWAQKQGQLWNTLDKEAKEFAIQKGVKVVTVPREEQAKAGEKMKPILAQYVQSMKAKGLPADEALKFCQDYMKSHP